MPLPRSFWGRGGGLQKINAVWSAADLKAVKGEKIKMEDYAFEYVDETAQEAEELRLPRVTWYNGNTKMKAAGGIVYTGGMTCRRESLGDDVEIPHWTIGSFDADGKTIETLENTYPVIAVVRHRRRWAKFNGNTCEEWYPITDEYRDGFKIQVEAAGFIKGYDSPVRFDLKGHASSGLLDAMRDHSAKIVSFANKSAPQGKSLPSYAFWLRLKPGKHQMVGKGKQSEATLPELLIDKEIADAYVRSLYVGKEQMLRFQQFFHELDGWSREWSSAGGNSSYSDSAYEMPEFAGHPQNELEGAQRHQARTMAATAGGNQPPSFSEVPPPSIDGDEIPF